MRVVLGDVLLINISSVSSSPGYYYGLIYPKVCSFRLAHLNQPLGFFSGMLLQPQVVWYNAAYLRGQYHLQGQRLRLALIK